MGYFQGKTVVISGASRGIGKAIGLRLAADGANIVVAAKTSQPHPRLPGTIHTAAAEMEAAGGKALALVLDVRDEELVEAVVAKTVETFGGIDILVNNASAIQLTGTMETPMKRFDLMHQINTRGTYLMTQKCLPHLLKARNPHVLNLSPPLNMQQHWFANHVAYTMAKYGMSMCVLGMSAEFKSRGVAFNALWPKTAIATAAVMNLLGGEAAIKKCRTPQIVADAAYAILSKPSRECTGNFFIDESLLRDEGITDFSTYADAPDEELLPDFFL